MCLLDINDLNDSINKLILLLVLFFSLFKWIILRELSLLEEFQL